MSNYKFGIYWDSTINSPAIGIGIVNLGREKYFVVNLLFWELAIGRTSL